MYVLIHKLNINNSTLYNDNEIMFLGRCVLFQCPCPFLFCILKNHKNNNKKKHTYHIRSQQYECSRRNFNYNKLHYYKTFYKLRIYIN